MQFDGLDSDFIIGAAEFRMKWNNFINMLWSRTKTIQNSNVKYSEINGFKIIEHNPDSVRFK